MSPLQPRLPKPNLLTGPRISPESHGTKLTASSNRTPDNLRPCSSQGGKSKGPMQEQKPLMEVKPTLSQTWTVDEPRSAMCVQSVDVHVSCSSHYDAQLAAFFIDPRAK